MKINLDTPAGDDVQIQIVPLIDVIFCILTFFILAALQLTRQQAIGVDLPRASTAQTQMRDMLVVTIDASGQLAVDQLGQPNPQNPAASQVTTQYVDRGQLYQILQTYHQQRPDGLLVLRASRTAFYNDVVQVLDLLRSVGGDRVALATLPTTNSQPELVNPSPAPGTLNPLSPFNSTSPANPTNPLNPSNSPNPTNPAFPGNSNQSLPGQGTTPTNPNYTLPNSQPPAGQGILPTQPGR